MQLPLQLLQKEQPQTQLLLSNKANIHRSPLPKLESD